MDYEDVINMTEVVDSSGAITPAQSRKDISHEIVFLICCTVAFVADVAIIFTILRFKQMRTVRNILIANWAVMDLCSLLVTPSGYRILSIFYEFSIFKRAECLLHAFGAAFHYAVVMCVFILLVDWCIAAFFHNASRKIRPYYKFALGFHWGVFIFFTVLYGTPCQNKYNAWMMQFLHAIIAFFTLAVFLIFMIILRIVLMVQKCRKKPLECPKLSLHLATGFMMCYILAFANILFIEFLRVRHPLFAMISACMVFCNAILNFVFLYFCDTHFQAHFNQVIRCNFQRYNNQITELDDHFSEVSFHNPSEQLINSSR
uniref:G-protein coupled receptors family 1 profile domain-containing protein n=1 Tax=Photinus pyralis TaxID=7054 RepID=A0A1Y1L9Q8_PHOPY